MRMTNEQIIQDLNAFSDYFRQETGGEPVCFGEAIRVIKESEKNDQKTKGRWIPEGKTYICSNCETPARRCTGYTDGSYNLLSDYCPDCGARMDEEDQEENT